MNQNIEKIKKEISHLQELSNKGELTSRQRDLSFDNVILPLLDGLNFKFEDINGNLFFKVNKEPLFRQNGQYAVGKRNKKRKNRPYYGIINTCEDYVISCVDDNYVLITNKDVLDYAKLLLCHLYECDGNYLVNICRQTFDKCTSDFDVMPALLDKQKDIFSKVKSVRDVKWNFFIRVSNTYSHNVKKYYAGFVNDRDQKIILQDENGVSLTVKKGSNIGGGICRDIFDIIVDKNLGNLYTIYSNFISLLNSLDQFVLPEIFKVFIFCEDFEIKESVKYVEKINKEINEKGENNVSADKKQRLSKHRNRLLNFSKLCKYTYSSNYNAYDLFDELINSEFISEADRCTDGETFYSNYYYPTKVGDWLQHILSRLNKMSSIVITNYEIIKRINALDNNLFSKLETDLYKYFQGTIDKMVQLIKKDCSDESFVSAFTIQKEFKKDCNPNSFFKAKAKLEKILNDNVKL